jgi:hypothetical protein
MSPSPDAPIQVVLVAALTSAGSLPPPQTDPSPSPVAMGLEPSVGLVWLAEASVLGVFGAAAVPPFAQAMVVTARRVTPKSPMVRMVRFDASEEERIWSV